MNVIIDEAFNVQVTYQGLNPATGSFVVGDMIATGETGGYIDGGYVDGGYVDGGMPGEAATVKDPLLSSWPFVIGVSAGVLVVSVVLGILLAKRKIKKGFELYED